MLKKKPYQIYSMCIVFYSQQGCPSFELSPQRMRHGFAPVSLSVALLVKLPLGRLFRLLQLLPCCFKSTCASVR